MSDPQVFWPCNQKGKVMSLPNLFILSPNLRQASPLSWSLLVMGFYKEIPFSMKCIDPSPEYLESFMNVEFSLVATRTDSILTKPPIIVNRFGISSLTLHGKLSFRDKVLGIRASSLTIAKVNLIENKLVRIEHENGNRLLPKIFINDKCCYQF